MAARLSKAPRGPYRTIGTADNDWAVSEDQDPGRRNLAIALRRARRKLCMTQQELAATSGVSRAKLAHLETAKRGMSKADFERLSEVLRPGPYDWAAVEAKAEQRWWPEGMTLAEAPA